MLITITIPEITEILQQIRMQKQTVGFVPTMGALHKGHIALIEKAGSENDVTVCSIFVNPTQFNNQDDLQQYPKTLESDVEKLRAAGCSIVFVPSVKEIYPHGNASISSSEIQTFDFGYLENIMEGKFRPGHFKGVAFIVDKLFRIIQPDRAYFGEKDFQQLAIIKELVKQQHFPLQVTGCPTVREGDGLAMSSRNIRLSEQERKEAVLISKTLFEAQKKVHSLSITALCRWAIDNLQQSSMLKVEYFEVVDSVSLLPAGEWSGTGKIRACTAVQLGKIRLIDNIELV